MPCDELNAVYFVTNKLSSEETEKFLAHVEKCNQCSEFVDLVARLRADRESIAQALATRRRKKPESEEARSGAISRSLSLNWKVFGAAAAGLILLFAAIYYYQRSISNLSYSSLATTEPYPFVPATFMGGDKEQPKQFLLNQGIASYSKGAYREAETNLLSYLSTNANDPEAHFLLALCYYFQYRMVDAIRHLRISLELTNSLDSHPEQRRIREKYYWYLAHSYLRKEDKERAVEELKHVVEFRGDYMPEAADLITRLEKIKGGKNR